MISNQMRETLDTDDVKEALVEELEKKFPTHCFNTMYVEKKEVEIPFYQNPMSRHSERYCLTGEPKYVKGGISPDILLPVKDEDGYHIAYITFYLEDNKVTQITIT